ncbi:MAG: hypothetical protein V1872_07425 [bacterium]
MSCFFISSSLRNKYLKILLVFLSLMLSLRNVYAQDNKEKVILTPPITVKK